MMVKLTKSVVKLVGGDSDGNSDKVVEITGNERQNHKEWGLRV